jgi:hypothetical protein
MSTAEDGINKIVWTSANDFEGRETGYFWMHEPDFYEMLWLFGIPFPDFGTMITARAKELGKDLVFEIDQTDRKIKVSWKPVTEDADGR